MKPPDALKCETYEWVTRCPNAQCDNYNQGGRLCQRTVNFLMDAYDAGEPFGLDREQQTIAWVLGVDRSRVAQIQAVALRKMKRRLEVLA